MTVPITTTTALDAHLAGDKQTAIDAATDIVRGYCGWHVTPVLPGDVLTVRGNGSDVLQLPTLRIVTVASVTDEDGVAVDPESYQVAPEGFLFGRCWTRDHTYTVTLEHGFDEAAALVGVVHRTAARGIASPDGSQVTSHSLGQARLSYGSTDSKNFAAGALPQSDLAILDRYRLPPLP